jgi:hypothetical protein
MRERNAGLVCPCDVTALPAPPPVELTMSLAVRDGRSGALQTLQEITPPIPEENTKQTSKQKRKIRL